MVQTTLFQTKRKNKVYGIVTFYYRKNKEVAKGIQRFDNVDCNSFQEKKRYFFEKNYNGITYKIIASRHFRYTGKTMEVEPKV